jgi:hypothetical protein
MQQNNKKWYYKFSTEKEVKNADGTSQKQVLNFAILKPNRRLREDGELFYASEISRFAKAGVLPKAAWNTILSNGGGSISDQDRELYGELLTSFRDKTFDIQSLLIKSDGNRTDEDKKVLDSLTTELESIRRQIQSFESSQINIFENTAESKARNRAILWWVTNLFYQESNGDFVKFFDKANLDDNLDRYDEIEESDDDELTKSSIRRVSYLVTLWFLGRADTEEDFKELDEANSKSDKKSEVEEVIEASPKDNA